MNILKRPIFNLGGKRFSGIVHSNGKFSYKPIRFVTKMFLGKRFSGIVHSNGKFSYKPNRFIPKNILGNRYFSKIKNPPSEWDHLFIYNIWCLTTASIGSIWAGLTYSEPNDFGDACICSLGGFMGGCMIGMISPFLLIGLSPFLIIGTPIYGGRILYKKHIK